MSDILEALDAVLADHDATSEALCQQYFAEAMEGVLDALDGAVGTWSDAAAWVPAEKLKEAPRPDPFVGWIEVGCIRDEVTFEPVEWTHIVERWAAAFEGMVSTMQRFTDDVYRAVREIQFPLEGWSAEFNRPAPPREIEAGHPMLAGAVLANFSAADPLGGLLNVVEPSVVHRRTSALEARPPVMPATRIPQRGSVYSLPVQQRRRR